MGHSLTTNYLSYEVLFDLTPGGPMPLDRKLRTSDTNLFNPYQPGGAMPFNEPQNFHLYLLLLAIVHPDGTIAIVHRIEQCYPALDRNQHPARLRERTLS